MRAVAVLLAAASTGCLGGGLLDALGGSDPEPALPALALLGSVRGPGLEPVVGANVTLLLRNATTTTDAEGRFLFDPAPLGNLSILVEAAGYLPTTVKHRLDWWEGATIEIRILADPRDPHVELLEIAGYVSCKGRVDAVPAAAIDCGEGDPNDASDVFVTLRRGATALVVEARWKASSAGADRLNVTVKEPRESGAMNDGTPIAVFAEGEGTSPLALRVPPGVLPRYGFGQGGDVKVRLGPADGALVIGQTVTLVVAVFYDGAPWDPDVLADSA